MSRRAAILLALVTAAVLPGCGPPTATVSGNVTIDGQPLDDGVISYTPAEGAGGTAATAVIEKGKYRLQTTPGQKWVQISAPAVVGQRKEYNGPDAPLMDIREERLPERFNAKTELKFDLKPGANVKDWVVESKQPPKGK